MKLDIKTMLITLGVCILFAFTATDIMTIRPAQPKSVYVDTFFTADGASRSIREYTLKGYIVKYCGPATTGSSYGLLIMEKY